MKAFIVAACRFGYVVFMAESEHEAKEKRV